MSNLFSEHTAVVQLIEAYGLGFVSSFTPCVFPLIPITLALFGARETKSRLQGFILGLAYVLGIALTYTVLGMVSAKLGLIFGSLLGNPWVVLALSIFLLIVALQTLEIIELKFLCSVQTKASGVGGKGLSGAFLMGTVSGFVAAPCIGPALLVVLSAAAGSQNIAWGASLMFFYSIGLGTIFILLATFSNLISKLPKSGNWLNFVKFFLGCLLIIIIIFLSQNYLSVLLDSITPWKNPRLLLIIYSLSIIAAWVAYSKNKKILRLVAAILMAFSLYQFFISAPPAAAVAISQNRINWLNDFDEALKQADFQKKPLLLDLYADWCAGCKEFEHETFSDPRVIDKFSTIITDRVDFTDTSSDLAVKISERYQVQGLPTLLLIKPGTGGEEIPDSRITGFLPPQEFLDHLGKYLK